jgi:hypothetical protein
LCCPAPLSACGNHSGEAERSSGISLKLFGFIAEPVFAFIPESCSESSRNAVRNHPGIAFILPRIPHPVFGFPHDYRSMGLIEDWYLSLQAVFRFSFRNWAFAEGEGPLADQSLGGRGPQRPFTPA